MTQAPRAGDGPIADFCAGLRRLRAESGADVTLLARQLKLSRTQLYALLAGQLKRPPDWDTVVRPLVRACAGNDATAVAHWQRRHAVMTGVWEELRRRDRAAARDGHPPAATGGIRYALPPGAAVFTGRESELDLIMAAATLDSPAAHPVLLIEGMPGVGKTTLAVQAARRAAAHFTDRQLFIDLHGHTPGRPPVAPADALAGLLVATGTDPGRLPPGLDDRAAMWRDAMAGQRAVLVLDNAAASSQIVPLLPASPTCLVLVTSRRQLADLPGGRPVLVELLTAAEAQGMFTSLAPRAAGQPSQVDELTRLAGYLPLAVSLLARVYARHPCWQLTDLIAETRTGLLGMAAEHASVAAAFGVSFDLLTPAQRSFLACLSLSPGPSADAAVAAAAAGVPVAEAGAVLDALHREGLLTEASYRRYGMHDLIRRYAAGQAAQVMPAAEQDAVLERLVRHFRDGAAAARAQLEGRPHPLWGPGSGPDQTPGFADDDQAVEWLRAERANLLACLDHDAVAGRLAQVELTAGVEALLREDGPWPEAIARNSAAAATAAALGNPAAAAHALLDQGRAEKLHGDFQGAISSAKQALVIGEELSDRIIASRALSTLGDAQRLTGDLGAAARALTRSLGVRRELADRRGEASVLLDLGDIHRMSGDTHRAVAALQQATAIYRDLDYVPGQAYGLMLLGFSWLGTDCRNAADAASRALALYRGRGIRLGEANSLTALGYVWEQTGAYQDAAEVLDQALILFGEVGQRLGQANALVALAMVRLALGETDAVAVALFEVEHICAELGLRLTEGDVLLRAGQLLQRTGDYHGAGQKLGQALAIFRAQKARIEQAQTLNATGALQRCSGDSAGAVQSYQQALKLARQIAHPLEEGRALLGLGLSARDDGDPGAAARLARQAHGIFERVGSAETTQARALLEACTAGSGAAQA